MTTETMRRTDLWDVEVRVTWARLAPAFVLMLIYAMLSYFALFDQTFFYESMDIPTPAHEFLIWSWGGKNTAVLVGLVLATLSRRRVALFGVIAMLFVMQMGDVNAGAQSGTNVFVTWIAFGVTVLQLVLLLTVPRRTTA